MRLTTRATVRASHEAHHQPAPNVPQGHGTELERACWYPKDGELCLSRLKPEETLVEVLEILDDAKELFFSHRG